MPKNTFRFMPTKSKSTRADASDKPVKSLLKPITGRKPAAPAEAEEKKPAKKTAGEKSEKPVSKRGPKAGEEAVAEKPKEVLSLIDQADKPKTPRTRTASALKNTVLPSISKIMGAEAAPVPAVAVAEAPATATPPEPPATEVSPTGEKLVH